MSGILVVAEYLNGQIAKISREIVGAASTVKADLGGPLKVVVLSDGDARLVESMKLVGVDEIISVDVGSQHFDATIYEDVIVEVGVGFQPSLILIGHTSNGLACAAAVAARIGAGYASDVIGLTVRGGKIVATRAPHGGKVNLDLAFPGKEVVLLTLRGATFATPDGVGSARVVQQVHSASEVDGRMRHIGYETPPDSTIDISKAEIILSVGRGIQSPDNIPRFAAIANKLGVTLGCSRPFADAGHLPKAHQVGQSGTVAASCKLYIAVGISGAVQHLYGMKHVDTIIAVNNDAAAPIFGFAKYGSTVDALEVAAALETRLNIGQS